MARTARGGAPQPRSVGRRFAFPALIAAILILGIAVIVVARQGDEPAPVIPLDIPTTTVDPAAPDVTTSPDPDPPTDPTADTTPGSTP